MLAGTPNRRVAAQHGVTEQSVRRHGEHHLRSALELAQKQQELDHNASLLDQLRIVHRRVGRVLDGAERAGDGRLVIAAAREVRACIESLGKWSGELREQHEHVVRAEPFDPETAAEIRRVLAELQASAHLRTRDIQSSPFVHEGRDAGPRALLPSGNDG